MSLVRASRLAAIAAGVAVALGIAFLRLRGLPVLLGGGVVYLGTLAMLWPRRAKPVPLPDGIARRDFDRVDAALNAAGKLMREHARLGTVREEMLFREIGDLIARIRGHLRGNPAHLPVIQRFTRHGMARLIQMVTDYADLKRRALPEHRDRLAAVLANMEEILPSLQRIDRACLENDLSALEISVEILAEQAGRARF